MDRENNNKKPKKENQQLENEIKMEVEYCLNCKKKPCSKNGCPLNNDIPAFIKQIKNENYEEAFNILSNTTVLPAICGRICPHYKQCMGSCIRGIKGKPVEIGKIEAIIGDWALAQEEAVFAKEKINTINKNEVQEMQNNKKEFCDNEKVNFVQSKNIDVKKVAIIGGGPAGLTCAAFLAKNGHNVTIYEKYDYLGGLLIHGIPEFRLPRYIIKKTIDQILSLGIQVKYNKELGKNLNIANLEKEYDYIVLAFGANVSSKMGIPGENLKGVYGGNELLEYNTHPNYKGKTVIVNGGGNVAMDTARTIKRLGAKRVIVVYRRAREQMPAEQKEIDDAIKEGVEFLFQNNIVKIIGNKNNFINETNPANSITSSTPSILEHKIRSKENENQFNRNIENAKVTKVELIKTELVQKEGETRLSPIDIKGSNYEIEADYVVMAIGSKPAKFVQNLGLELNSRGYIKVDENGQTSNPKIYAIGDLAGNKSTVAWAARSGRDIANILI